jgi:hypothetical protein
MDDKKFRRGMSLGMAGLALLFVPTGWIFLSPLVEIEALDHFAAMSGITWFVFLLAAALHAS